MLPAQPLGMPGAIVRILRRLHNIYLTDEGNLIRKIKKRRYMRKAYDMLCPVFGRLELAMLQKTTKRKMTLTSPPR